eukprot:2203008-Rhodomonas_salina.2
MESGATRRRSTALVSSSHASGLLRQRPCGKPPLPCLRCVLSVQHSPLTRVKRGGQEFGWGRGGQTGARSSRWGRSFPPSSFSCAGAGAGAARSAVPCRVRSRDCDAGSPPLRPCRCARRRCCTDASGGGGKCRTERRRACFRRSEVRLEQRRGASALRLSALSPLSFHSCASANRTDVCAESRWRVDAAASAQHCRSLLLSLPLSLTTPRAALTVRIAGSKIFGGGSMLTGVRSAPSPSEIFAAQMR